MKSIELTNEFTNTEANFLRDGISAAQAGNKALARSLLLRAIERDSNNEIGWQWLAYVADTLPEAIEYLRRVLAINPQNGQAQASLNKVLLRHGIALAKEGSKPQARSFLLEASYLNPGNELVWLWLASVAENSDDAVACLHKVMEIDPANEHAISWMSKLRSQPATQTADEEQGIGEVVEPEAQAETEQVVAEAAVRADEEAERKGAEAETGAHESEAQIHEAEARGEETSEARAMAKQRVKEAREGFDHSVNARHEAERRQDLARRFSLIVGARGEDEIAQTEAKAQEGVEASVAAEQARTEAEARTEDADRANEEAERKRVEAEARAQAAVARLQEAEAKWREEALAEARTQKEAKARAMAEQVRIEAEPPVPPAPPAIDNAHAKVMAELKAEAEAEQVRAEAAIRASDEADLKRAEASAKARLAEAMLREVEDRWKEKSEARVVAEQRVKDAQEEFKRSVNARREAEMARAEIEAEVRMETKARVAAEEAKAEAEAKVEDAALASQEAERRRAEAEARVLKAVARLQEAEAKWRKGSGTHAETPVAAAHVGEADEPKAQARIMQTVQEKAQFRVRQPLLEEDRPSARQAVQEMGGQMGMSPGHTLALPFGADNVDFKVKAKLVSYCLLVILLVTFVWVMTNYY